MNIGRNETTGTSWWTPINDAPQPHWKTITITP